MIAQECLPSLGWRPSTPCHVFGDGGLAHIDAKLQKFAMDPRSAPERVGKAHLADQSANFERDPWSAAARLRLPTPEQAQAGTMPTDDRPGFDNRQRTQNARRDGIEAGEDQT